MREVLVGMMLIACGNVTSQLPDAPPVVDPDASDEPERVSMSELRELPDGPTNVTVVVTHTYLRQRNFHLQADQSGPAVSLFVPANMTPPVIQIGNTVELHVTQVSTFDGNKQISAATVITNDGAVANLDAISQQLTVAPNEDLEGELVRIQRGTVMNLIPPTFTVQLSSNAIIDLFSPVGVEAGLCMGATFDVRAPVIEFQGTYEVASTVVTDFTNVNTAGCI
jgi:hypothetical protein